MTPKKRPPRMRPGWLRMGWGYTKDEGDDFHFVYGGAGASKSDAHLLFYLMCTAKIFNGGTFVEWLDRRGYDLTTLRLDVRVKATEKLEPTTAPTVHPRAVYGMYDGDPVILDDIAVRPRFGIAAEAAAAVALANDPDCAGKVEPQAPPSPATTADKEGK